MPPRLKKNRSPPKGKGSKELWSKKATKTATTTKREIAAFDPNERRTSTSSGVTPGDTPSVVLEASKDLSEDKEILLKAWIDMGGKEPDLKKSKGEDVSEWEGIVVERDRVVEISK
ncbi:hypothetical protein TrST_g7784 [Triparma strigata]|uniref:Uncharacterized protein n=1 Tax=Triparma strigata TaxID=1606541 RepID=A0A9W7B5W3_9STRA|nr:hypothetical protein TrST_g7784 [Triparma strigata]